MLGSSEGPMRRTIVTETEAHSDPIAATRETCAGASRIVEFSFSNKNVGWTTKSIPDIHRQVVKRSILLQNVRYQQSDIFAGQQSDNHGLIIIINLYGSCNTSVARIAVVGMLQ